MRKSQPLLLEHDTRLADGSESYSSNSTFSDSYSDSSDLANWEEHVAADGTLFYAEYMPQLRKATQASSGNQERRIEFTRSSTLRMGKKMARRQQQQQTKTTSTNKVGGNNAKNAPASAAPTSAAPVQLDSFKFSNINTSTTAENMKQLELFITAADRYRFGRRSTAVESILGFRVVPFVDQPECLMFDGFVHDMPNIQQQTLQQPIKRGDWFKSLDDIEIRTSNVDELLLQFIEPTKVCLKFQGAHVEVPAAEQSQQQDVQQLKKVENFGMFAELFDKFHAAESKLDNATAAAAQQQHMPFGMLILPPECYQHDQHKDSLYYYPEPASSNFLYKARGSFLTLNAVLTEELQTKPLVSKLLVDEVQYYVSYRALNGFLVLFAYATQYVTLPEASLRADELISYMRFAFPSLNLQHFDNANSGTQNFRKFLNDFCDIQRVRLLASYKRQSCQFEEMLPESRSLPLPKEAQLRVFDALSEMEAMDYRNWNDEPLNTHREFFIYGSVLYYDHFVLASQMPLEVRANVESFLRCRGIFDFIGMHYVKELYVWEEISLANATGRYFLTICSRSHLLLAVILKIFDAPDLAPNATIHPSLFYIEEIQETLDHLIQCGIESLAMFWSVSNKRPEVLDKSEALDDSQSGAGSGKESNKLDQLLKQKFTNNSGSSNSSMLQTHRSISYDEDAHICSSLGGSSIHSLTPSEDDSSRKRLSGTTNNNNNSTSGIGDDNSDSGSDWDNFAEQHPLHYGLDTDNPTHMTESLWKEINNVVPVKISAGWKNAVFYYVYVDNANGTVFCPLKANSEAFPFLSEMRKACHIIHEVLQNTKHFRRLLAMEQTKAMSAAGGNGGNNAGSAIAATLATSSKGMLAIKEHGMTIQVRQDDAASAGADSHELGVVKGRFVVVGRLFHTPTKEVYVCHRPDVPQNMVEMAFRLSFFSVG